MPLIINSPIAAIRKRTKGKTESVTLHFLGNDADGNQRMDIVHPNGFNVSQYKVGDQVMLSVTPTYYNEKNGEAEFTIIDDMVEHQFLTNGSGEHAAITRQ